MGLLEEARRYLIRHGIEAPDADIRLLATYAAGLPLRDALGSPFPDLRVAAAMRFAGLVARRGRERVPAAYLVGAAEFMGLELKVTPAVLIPRPSTETLVERALDRPGRFLDVGTGSGAVAIALAAAGLEGAATDVSEEALAVARENAERHGVAGRITFVKADLLPEGTFDMVVSNPPYVASGEFAGLAPEILHEPKLALDGGPDGMDLLRRIVGGARRRAPRLLVECAPAQAAAVGELALRAGYGRFAIHKDLDGFDRVVEAVDS